MPYGPAIQGSFNLKREDTNFSVELDLHEGLQPYIIYLKLASLDVNNYISINIH